MNKYDLVKKIEAVAPPETADEWDLSGWIIDNPNTDVNKIMLCLTITKDVINQAKENSCDMIISHHPLFFVPLDFNCGINLYCAHTNLDKAPNGTTETLIKALAFTQDENQSHEYLRFCTLSSELSLNNLIESLKNVSKNIRISNKQNIAQIKKIAFCSGSGTEFWQEAKDNGADIFVTGDLKFHTAVDSEIPIIDIGHFESEILVLNSLKNLLNIKKITIAKEISPVNNVN
ncbi:Nif3-like dinuclear metal center hexameric protein [bacterium]|nr:Nif3-like dinuclear metal center hexameric protein [bacterium]